MDADNNIKMKRLIFTVFSCILLGLGNHGAYSQVKKWTLNECVNYALEKNISIRQSKLDYESSQIDKKVARGNFLPTINASGQHNWINGLTQNVTTGILEIQTTQNSSFNGTVGIDIYKGLQHQNTFRRSKLALIASQYQLLKMQEDVALNVANAYLQVLFNRENLKVQKELLRLDSIQMNRTGQLVDAGTLPRGDLLDIKATVSGDNQKKIAAENQLLISKLSLAQLLQLDDFQNFDVADEEYDSKENAVMMELPSAIYAKAKEQRTELKIAKANLEVAEKDVTIARGGYQPSLQGFYNFNTRISYSDIPVSLGNNQFTTIPAPRFWDQFIDNKGHTFGVQLSVPILNGFSVRNNVQRAKVALERSKIAYEQSELDLERNVYTAFTDAQGALKSYEAAELAVEARKEAFRYATERYEVGLINTLDLNQSQTLYANAQSEVLRTKYDYMFRVKILEFYFGIPIIQK